MERWKRVRGCLLGGAIGDALGAPIEFDRSKAARRSRSSAFH
ncbi:ADP-ribosylglycohydrolase family protein [Nonomuraea africana]